ncbi:hypothetical protein, partial [Mesorhizobium sp.]|uniref:hypothetical protein n=1 Tax=Mesorhizobium sp. TaxID=1871066 RepID=UPI00344FA73B
RPRSPSRWTSMSRSARRWRSAAAGPSPAIRKRPARQCWRSSMPPSRRSGFSSAMAACR